MPRLSQISLLSCNACQNRCNLCAHRAMMDEDRGYQMPLDDVQKLIDHLRATGTTCDKFSFGGPGEPLLWRHFNEAVRLVHGANVASRVEATTNGIALKNVDFDVWQLLNPMQISNYGYPIDGALIPSNINVVRMPRAEFWSVVPDAVPVGAVTGCSCPGVSYYKGRIFPHCGPVLFEAAQRAGVDPFAFSIPLAEWKPDKPPAMTDLPCRWCWGNPAVPKQSERWQQEAR